MKSGIIAELAQMSSCRKYENKNEAVQKVAQVKGAAENMRLAWLRKLSGTIGEHGTLSKI